VLVTYCDEMLVKFWFLLDELRMLLKEGAQEEAEVLYEHLLIICASLVRLSNVGGRWQHLDQHTETIGIFV